MKGLPRIAVIALATGILMLAAVPALARHLASPTGSKALILRGSIQGTETHRFSIPDTGSLYTWNGKGMIKPLGAVTGRGKDHGVGFIKTGIPTGRMTLSTATGSIRLEITYDTTPGFAPVPSHGRYVITGGTGAFSGAAGTGSLLRTVGSCSDGSTSNPCPVGVPFAVTYRFHGTRGGGVRSSR